MSDDKALAERIRAAKEKIADTGGESKPPGASRYSIELLSGIAVGGGAGWLLDDYIGTKPWFFILFLLLGMAGGFFNIVRLASGKDFGHTDRDSK